MASGTELEVEVVSRGLAPRLLLAQMLVVAVAGSTFLAVFVAVGPKIFDQHIHDAVGLISPSLARHLHVAFADTVLLEVGLGGSVAILASLTVSLLVARRLTRPIARLSQASRSVANGQRDVRVPTSGLGIEFGVLEDAFNEMASALDAVEATRRRILSDLAHELRTPLATIDAHLEGLVDGVVVADRSTWSILLAETGRLGRLVEDIAEVTTAEERLLQLRRRLVAPKDLVLQAADAARPRFNAGGVALKYRFEERLPQVYVDVDRIGEVFHNLLSNAFRHTPSGESVTISVTTRPHVVEFSVVDSGEGIPSAALPHVYERFYRIDAARDRDHGGSGIGLAIVKAIVEAHGGTVAAASDGPGTGSRFAFTLPAA